MKKRILIGEDDPSIRKITRVRLEHEGYEVVDAGDGEAVLQQADGALPIHLILLDIQLPKRNGYDVCRILRRRHVTANIPIIIFSATEFQQQRLAERCIEVGATDWIRKPFRTKDLMARIHRALGEPEEGTHGQDAERLSK